jgi:hypothetical protein
VFSISTLRNKSEKKEAPMHFKTMVQTDEHSASLPTLPKSRRNAIVAYRDDEAKAYIDRVKLKSGVEFFVLDQRTGQKTAIKFDSI